MPAGVNWVEARDFWLALDPPRGYEAVARQFGVSGTRVRFVARRDNWQELADEIDQRALEQAKRRIVFSRSERVQRTLGIVDGLLRRFDERLDDLDLRPGELPALVKLAELLEGEATERISSSELQDALVAGLRAVIEFVPKKDRERAMAAYREALGAIESQERAA